MPTADKLGWGVKDPDIEAPVLWGARAIVDRDRKDKPLFDLLWDRQDWLGEETHRLKDKLNDRALDALWVHLRKTYDTECNDDEDHFISLEGVKFWYNSHTHCGYLYITACLTD